MKFYAVAAFTATEQLLDIARAAEEAGLQGVALPDHVFFPEQLSSAYPYAPDGKPFWTSSTPWPDVWVSIGAMAAVTSQLQFLTGVYVLPMRNLFVVAKAASTAAVLSGNRVTLGAGAGWMREEFEQLGQDFPTRGRRMDEMIAVLRKLWGGGMVEHHGRYCDFERLELSPVPSQPIPIYIGGESETALRRAARLGDGWISVQHTSEECKTLVERINRLRREYGRADQPFDIVMACTDAVDLAGYRRLTDFGVTSLLTAPWYLYGGDPTSLQTKHDALLRFGAEIVAQLS